MRVRDDKNADDATNPEQVCFQLNFLFENTAYRVLRSIVPHLGRRDVRASIASEQRLEQGCGGG